MITELKNLSRGVQHNLTFNYPPNCYTKADMPIYGIRR